MTTLRVLGAVMLVLVINASGFAQKKPTSPVPGDKSTWNLNAFNAYFAVVETAYDAKTRSVRWTLQTIDSYRTSDFVRDLDQTRPFTFVFLDEDEKDLATIRLGASDFEGIPKDRLVKKGTHLILTLEVPNVLDRTIRVELRRGAMKR